MDETPDLEIPKRKERLLTYRCSCGGDVRVPPDGSADCEKCGRAITLKGLDASQTVSFCSDVGSGTSFQLLDGPDRSGESLGHFRLLSKLGYGGMGAVYRSLDESLQRFVAVKVMRSADEGEGATAKQVTRLLDEAVSQARLNHPNVVTIYYVGRDGEEPFFAMELLPGPTLAKLIQDEPLPYSSVIRYAGQVVDALAQASAHGLVHGDIKPSNLILADDLTVKLGDFGLAKTEHTKPTGGISGTLSYMAPELSQGGQPTDQSDMYSLGITLFELTFGRRPYAITGTTLKEQLTSKQVAEAEFPERWPTTLPEEWAELLRRLMAKEAEDRFPDYETLQLAIQGLAPVGVTNAGLLNRALAYTVDLAVWGVLALLLFLPFLTNAPLAFAVQELRKTDPQFAYPLGVLLDRAAMLRFLSMLVPFIAAYTEFKGWRTPGRYLFQLRVVDPHGLRLQPRKRFLRSVLRYTPVLVSIATLLLLTIVGLEQVALLLLPIPPIILMFNTISVLGRRRMAIHDRVVHSHVVLDTQSGK
ncbi:MAG: hypothetical protein Aurels2KO_03550 [Aureliella sp.]